MNYLDITIALTLAAFLLKGVMRGLLKEVCSLAGLVVGALLAFYGHTPLAQWLLDVARLPSQVAVAAAFLSLFLVTVIVFSALGYLLSRFVKLVFLGGFNRVAGAIFGLAQAVVLLSLLCFGLSLAQLPEFLEESRRTSQLLPPFVDLGEELFRAGHDFFSGR